MPRGEPGPQPGGAVAHQRPGAAVLLALGAGILAFDQLTKYLVVRSMPIGESRPIIDGVLHLSHYRNTGAAFGLLRGIPGTLALLAMVGVVVAVVLVSKSPWPMPRIGAALIASGALGNLTDRVARGFPLSGSVVDFVDFRFWPAFNVADASIVVGVGLMLLASYREGTPIQDAPVQDAPVQDAPARDAPARDTPNSV